jgi:hypothetical protein
MVLMPLIPNPSFLPEIHYTFNEYLVFDMNVSAVLTAVYLAYYFILEPIAAVRLLCCKSSPATSPDACFSCSTRRSWCYHY